MQEEIKPEGEPGQAAQQVDAALVKLSQDLKHLKDEAELRALQENPVSINVHIPDLLELAKKNQMESGPDK